MAVSGTDRGFMYISSFLVDYVFFIIVLVISYLILYSCFVNSLDSFCLVDDAPCISVASLMN